ncbi:unnamed protein product, partial [marine sediment metagenome]
CHIFAQRGSFATTAFRHIFIPPFWWCLGSFVQGKEQCPELIEARVDFWSEELSRGFSGVSVSEIGEVE